MHKHGHASVWAIVVYLHGKHETYLRHARIFAYKRLTAHASVNKNSNNIQNHFQLYVNQNAPYR